MTGKPQRNLGQGWAHAPQKELYVDHSWRNLLHHIGDEVELVPWTGQLVETCAGSKDQGCQRDLLASSSPRPRVEEALLETHGWSQSQCQPSMLRTPSLRNAGVPRLWGQ